MLYFIVIYSYTVLCFTGSINNHTIIIPLHLDVSFIVSKPGKGRDDWRKTSCEMADDVYKVPVDNGKSIEYRHNMSDMYIGE